MFDAFLQISGIEGESTDDAHSKWIEIHSFSFNVSQPSSGSDSTGGGASAQRADFSDFSIVKAVDKATPKLMLACADGTHYDEVKIEFCRAGGDKLKYLEYIMNDVIVSSYSPGGSAEGPDALPLEEVSFNFGKIKTTYTQQKREGGGGGGNVAAGWDLKANKKL